VNKHGIDRAIDVLSDDESKQELVFEDKYVNLVLNTISEKFSITMQDLIFKKHTRSDIKFAIGFSVFYLYTQMTLREINDLIFATKNKSLLSKYRLMIEQLNPRYKSDLPYLKIKIELDNLLKK
jgi:DNA topoisomerase VI subunit B